MTGTFFRGQQFVTPSFISVAQLPKIWCHEKYTPDPEMIKTQLIHILMGSHGLKRTWWEVGQEALSRRMKCTKPLWSLAVHIRPSDLDLPLATGKVRGWAMWRSKQVPSTQGPVVMLRSLNFAQELCWVYRISEGCSGFLEQEVERKVSGHQWKLLICYCRQRDWELEQSPACSLCWVTHLLVPWCLS